MNTSQDNPHVFDASECSELEESLRKLSSISEEQFATIKDEKWYRRLWDMVTFSKKGEIRLCDQISTLAQAQQIVAQFLLKESQQNKAISELVNNNATYIKKLAGQSVSFKRELTSIKNILYLLNEINNEYYNGYTPITAICIILSQLDNDILADNRALNNIILSLNNHNVINGKNIEVIDFLMDSASMTEEVPLVYTELSSVRENYFANLVLSLIEELFFKRNASVNVDDVVLNIAIAHNVEKKYDSTTLNKIFISLLTSIIEEKTDAGTYTITNATAKQKREEAEKLFYSGKLIDAYPKFIQAVDLGDARACYFAALYYGEGYGTTRKNKEFYKKYIDLGIKRKDPFCCLDYARYLYSQGQKTKYNYWSKKILPQLSKMAEKGDAVACHLIAFVTCTYYLDHYQTVLEKGDELSDNEAKALFSALNVYKSYSSKAIDAGYWPAAFYKCFSQETFLDNGNREEYLEKYGWLFEKVEWVVTQVFLGVHYLSLDNVENKYYKNAAEYFQKAYELQKEDSICGFISFFMKAGIIKESITAGIEKRNIDILYYKGLGCEDATMLLELGNLYNSGVGENHIGMSRSSAFEHYERAYEKYAEQEGSLALKNDIGMQETALNLGVMLLMGIGTEKNNERAVQYLEFAVQNGEKRAIKPLANCYLKGIGVNKNLRKYNELMASLENE